ncbi:MAG: NAD(+) synthase [Bacteroidales bacterium]
MNYGFIKVAAAIPSVKVADCNYNVDHIKGMIEDADSKGVSLIAFPELSLTAYTCGDLFGQQLLLEDAENALKRLVEETAHLPQIVIVGMPVALGNMVFNTAVVFSKGEILGVVPKIYLPNYSEFYEARWFTSGSEAPAAQLMLCGSAVPFGTDLLFEHKSVTFGVEVCEDLWVPIPPSSKQALQGASLLINISASNELVGKHDYLRTLIEQQSARLMGAYLYASAGFGESTTDLVFAGNAIVSENGSILAEAERFAFDEQLVVCDVDIEKLESMRRRTTTYSSLDKDLDLKCRRIPVQLSQPTGEYQLTRSINPRPFVPSDSMMHERCQEIFNIQVNGLAQRIRHTHAKTAVVGISGGLDSTLALLVCVQTFDKLNLSREGIVGVTMPGFGTTDRTYNNAINLMRSLGITIREISIRDAVLQHFKDLGIDERVHDVTYENSQARERTQILMDVSNQMNGLVIGTGDLSELALGWATYNGDHMSMYGVNGSIPKTLVQYLVKWVAEHKVNETAKEILLDIIDTPISPELIPADENGDIAQKTEDLVGPYELHDFFLFNFIRHGYRPKKIFFLAKIAFKESYSEEVIKKWLQTFFRRFFQQQFKRSCLPDGPKVGTVSLSPRGDWRMPSDATSALWLKEIENL